MPIVGRRCGKKPRHSRQRVSFPGWFGPVVFPEKLLYLFNGQYYIEGQATVTEGRRTSSLRDAEEVVDARISPHAPLLRHQAPDFKAAAPARDGEHTSCQSLTLFILFSLTQHSL